MEEVLSEKQEDTGKMIQLHLSAGLHKMT